MGYVVKVKTRESAELAAQIVMGGLIALVRVARRAARSAARGTRAVLGWMARACGAGVAAGAGPRVVRPRRPGPRAPASRQEATGAGSAATGRYRPPAVVPGTVLSRTTTEKSVNKEEF